MPTPDRTAIRRRLALGAAVLIALIILAVVVATGRHETESPPPPPAAAAPPPVRVDPQPLPLPPPPLGRADLIATAARAASTYAAGQPAPKANAELVGRKFRVAIPFGCGGPAEKPTAAAYWTRDGRRGAIRLVAKPQDWTKAAWVSDMLGGEAFDAIEGFWLPRPWTSSEACPPDTDGAAGPPVQTLGLAMFFEPGSSRVLQRGGRAYEHVLNAPDGDQPIAPKGFRLVLAGRVTGFKDGQPAHCRSDGPNVRPVCLIAVVFDEVVFEDPVSGQTLAQWRMN